MQYQTKLLERAERERQGKEEEEEEEEFATAEHEERAIRRRLSETEGAIAGLLRDLRYECEPQLLSES